MAYVSYTADIGRIVTALGLFASAIKCGEPWTDRCQLVNDDAHNALIRIGEMAEKAWKYDELSK